jgi:hypothetical protein
MIRYLTRTSLCMAMSICLSFIAIAPLSNAAQAAGRTYSSSKEVDPRSQTELCRLKRLERTENGNNCIYQRQTGGQDKILGLDFGTNCQKQFLCKKLK